MISTKRIPIEECSIEITIMWILFTGFVVKNEQNAFLMKQYLIFSLSLAVIFLNQMELIELEEKAKIV